MRNLLMRKTPAFLLLFCLLITIFIRCSKDDNLSSKNLSKEELGKLIFLDKKLSNPAGQSCSSCHAAGLAFTDPDHAIVSQGAVAGLFGNRNAPSVKYAMFSPVRHYDDVYKRYIGGQFWDGRANTLEEQATKPFFNPLEMNLTDINMFVTKFKQESFYASYVKLYGEKSDPRDMLSDVGDAITAFEKSEAVNPFNSKFDLYMDGKAALTIDEEKGFALYKGKANCAGCHLVMPDVVSGEILFTDFSYHNIGVPKNIYNPFYTIPSQYNAAGKAFVDLGLGGITHSAYNNGEFKVPSLRNVAVTAPYFHNGVFSTLQEVVHFYNKRNAEFTAPEVNENVNMNMVGDLKLTSEEEKQVVAFLKTLTDDK